MAAFALMTLASCSQEDMPAFEMESGGAKALAITVTDGGYSANGQPQSRATENGYATKFTAGDACGMYLVRDGNVIGKGNIKIVASSDGKDGLKWGTDDGSEILVDKPDETSMYLYYPYQDDMEGKTNNSASNEAGFFDKLISEWQPKADQSDYATGYTASDLMTATGTLSSNSVEFSMTHRMALAVIDLPKTVYKFTDTTIPDYILVPADFTGEAKPCRMADGTYRYLVKPQTTSASQITGSYAEGKKEFRFTPNGLTGSKYKTYKIDGANEMQKDYTLQAGDLFCSNADRSGWYVIPKELAPTETDNCIGIVFYVERHNSDNSNYAEPLNADGPTIKGDVHGYVVALTDVDAGSFMWEDGPQGEYDQRVDASTDENDWNGYSNCRKIHDYVTSHVGWNMSHFPAANACETYGTQSDWRQPFAAPNNTSGWFLPSCGQLRYLHEKSSLLSPQILNVNNLMSDTGSKDHVKWFNTGWYWSSSESENYSSYAWSVDFRYGYADDFSKDINIDVRAVLAF